MDTLYLQLTDINNLRNAWRAVREKGSAGGIDGETIKKWEDVILFYPLCKDCTDKRDSFGRVAPEHPSVKIF